jgi:diguanylate cyclase (GGDEF)-like protein
MRTDGRLLVIGPPAFREAVTQALPRCQSVAVEHVLPGIWQAGQQPFEGVLLCLSGSRNQTKAMHSLRQVAPQARIVVACAPANEPAARRAVRDGADEYVLEPLTAGDLEQALQVTAPAAEPLRPVTAASGANQAAAAASGQEEARLADVLRNLGEGTQAVLERVARLLCDRFDANYAAIDFDGLSAAVGTPEPVVLSEPIHRQGAVVGSLALGRCRQGSYVAATAARLADYARLTEAVLTVARDQAHWQDLAWTDDLSHLRNRRYFERRLDELLAQCGSQRACLTVLLFDIDDFKTYNDRFGHDTGDALIGEVAYLLTRCSRGSDVVARFGGDEFAVIFWDAEKPRVPGSKHPSAPVALAERFRQALHEHDFKCLGPHAPGPVTISGGLASYPWDAQSRTDLLRAADTALLLAKRTGKNRIELASQANSK